MYPFRRLAACGSCGARHRTLVDTARGPRAHCMGCGGEVTFPFATEAESRTVGRAGQVVMHD